MTFSGFPRTAYTLPDCLVSARNRQPQRIALVDESARVSYDELLDRARRFAVLLRTSGIRRGDRIAMYLPRSSDAVIALFGIWFAGAVGVIINDVLKSRQVNFMLEHAEVSLLVTNSRLRALLENPAISSSRILLVDQTTLPGECATSSPTIGNDLALIIYTSGSTGMPKGIMLSHTNLLAGAYIIADYLCLTEKDILISLLPFSFDYGLNQLLTAVLIGGTLIIERAVMPEDICKTLQEENVTGMAAVPMLWQQLASPRSTFTKRSFPSLRYLTNTGGRLPEPIVGAFRKAHPSVDIYLMFGLTEAFRSTFLPPEEVDRRPASIGKAIPNCEVLLLNERGESCGPGEVGEIVHRGATVSMGYWKDPVATAERFRPAPFQAGRGGLPEIAVYSGDYATMDEEGFLYFIGRRDQMIKSRGMRVSPEEIEDCIFASGMAAHVVVFASPRTEVDNDIVVAIVPHDSASFRSEDLLQYGKREMPAYMRPDIVWLLERFPETSSGKPDRVRLKEMFAAQRKSPSQARP
jgi:acyl-CoA ligase (AMP-forming) (exosortase A-associated)